MKKNFSIVFFLSLFFLVAFLDQFFKKNFSHSFLNSGIAFGLSWFPQAVIIFFTFFFLVLVARHIKRTWGKGRYGIVFFQTLLFSGGCSNLFDRIFYQGVRDYLSLSWYGTLRFNIADVAIVTGAIGWILLYKNRNDKNIIF